MSGQPQSLALGDAGYAVLLQRFEKQPVRYVHEIPHERPSSAESPVKLPPIPAYSGEALSKADKETAQKLRDIWGVFVRDGLSPNPVDGQKDFEVWRKACRQNFFSPLMCVEVICRGISINDVDMRYKMQAGTTLLNMHQCLELL